MSMCRRRHSERRSVCRYHDGYLPRFCLTQKKVKANLAMTGEITLRGKVLPVGGIKEKILAAKRAGIKEIILSDENRKNIEEIQDIYLKGLTFHYVKDIKEVFAIALTDEK